MNTNLKNSDQRTNARIGVSDNVDVLNAHSLSSIGQLANISADGLMIASLNEIDTNSVLQVRIAFHNGAELTELEIGIESLWCQDTNESGVWWTGFHIIDISPEHQEILDSMLDDLSNE